MKKTIELLKAKLESAQLAVHILRDEIRKCADGFTYVISIHSYGSSTWHTEYTNTVFIQELCDEYRDGYNGLVHVYTNNPKINEEVKDYGCLSVFPLEKLPEDRRNMSMSKAMLRFVTP